MFTKNIFQDKGVQKALGRYVKILEGKEKAKYLSADLDSKVKKAEELIQSCVFCERKCGVNRKKGKLGWCKVGYESRVTTAFAHYGEEPELVPSGTIFFSGCTFHCVCCQNWDISQYPLAGEVWSPEKITDWIQNTQCININFVGGEPTPNLHNILKAMKLSKRSIPMIWNSNMYMSKESMNLLDGVIDVYLADFKYGNNECALKLSKVPKYFDTMVRNFKLARKSAEMLIRVLVLPNHIECCDKKIIDWIAENLGNDVRVNIMSQYRPVYEAFEYPKISRRLEYDEYWDIVRYAEDAGLWNIEVQGL